jgi:hypothetical protein
MSAAPKQEKPICGWNAIADAVSRAIGTSCCRKTAQRYAKPGRPNRLPVFRYDNGVVYLLPSALSLWREARSMPLGAREPGRPRG